MNLPFSTSSSQGLLIAALLGFLFGVFLNKGRVSEYNVIVNLFRLKDFTVLKIMLTAIVIGGLGVFAMKNLGWIESYHIKSANLLGVLLGAGLFGIGMALYGYCPGTAVAAVAAGRIHAMAGFLGMIAGGIAYASTYSWIESSILSVWQLGEVRLPEITNIPTSVWWGVMTVAIVAVLIVVERMTQSKKNLSAEAN